jgi:hypothetical protein
MAPIPGILLLVITGFVTYFLGAFGVTCLICARECLQGKHKSRGASLSYFLTGLLVLWFAIFMFYLVCKILIILFPVIRLM